MPHKQADDILSCNMDQINAYPKGNWYRLERKTIDKQFLHGSECSTKTGLGGDKSAKIESGVRQGCCLSPIDFNL